jgi:hypothetical protein
MASPFSGNGSLIRLPAVFPQLLSLVNIHPFLIHFAGKRISMHKGSAAGVVSGTKTKCILKGFLSLSDAYISYI